MGLLETIIIAIVEGITEFLPISSTGHMIIAGTLLGVQKNEFTKIFEISIQLGAILAVIVFYWRRFFQFRRWQFYLKLVVAVIPAIIAGLLFGKYIDYFLESPITVAISLLLGGIVLLFVDDFFKNPTIESDDQISFSQSFLIGCWQVIAMIPGVSRSGASIIGGLQQKLTRHLAAEFSFFIAAPTMLAATVYELFIKQVDFNNTIVSGYEVILMSQQNIISFIVGNIVAFLVAMMAIKFFINYLKVHGFRSFGVYRIFIGSILLVLILTGNIN